MPDVFTREKRSEVMSKIRSKGTKIEMQLKAALETTKISFVYQPEMFGHPDFLIPPKIAIFCDSSFWHGRNWEKLKPKLPKKYWQEHIGKNRERDKKVNSVLKEKGYYVIRFWDDQIKNEMDDCIATIREKIKTSKNS